MKLFTLTSLTRRLAMVNSMAKEMALFKWSIEKEHATIQQNCSLCPPEMRTALLTTGMEGPHSDLLLLVI